jgi:hypothetical protein
MSSPIHLRRRAAAKYLQEHWGLPCAEKTLAKLASIGGGPCFYRYNRIPLYRVEDLDTYAEAKLGKAVRSTSE